MILAWLLVAQAAFTQTPEGDWRTMIRHPDGTLSEFVWVPPTKFSVVPKTDLRAEDDGIRYHLALANQPMSKQGIVSIIFRHAAADVRGLTLPGREWEVLPVDNQVLAIAEVAAVPHGIQPGEQAYFELVSRAYPGVLSLELMGGVPEQSVPSEHFTPKQYREIERLSGQLVHTSVIGPAIATDQPNLLARIATHYRHAFVEARHPQAGSFPQNGSLAALRDISRVPVTDPWHQQLSSALQFCVQQMERSAP